MKRVNFTIELVDEREVERFEVWLKEYTKVISVSILPDTKEMYEEDSVFKCMVKEYKKARKIMDDYINSHNK